MTPLQFSLVGKTQPVSLAGPDGKEQAYTLLEMPAQTRDLFLDKLAARMSTDASGKTGIKRFEGMQAALLTLCLQDSSGTLVPETTIQSWPGSVVSALFAAAQKLNHLDRREGELEAEAKKD